MIFLFAALRIEAMPFIRNLNLEPEEGPFSIYRNEDTILTVTGTGPLSAAAATASVLSTHPVGEDDFLMNVGTAAGIANACLHTVYRIHKVTDLSSGRDYYPDLLITPSGPEATLITGGKLCSNEPDPDQISWDMLNSELPLLQNEPVLYDMEASGIVTAASHFLAPHQIRILKAVSDEGTPVTGREVSSLAELLYNAYLEELPCMKAQCVKEAVPAVSCDSLADDLHASLTMRRSLSQLLYYCELAGIDYHTVIDSYYQRGLLPANDRQKGKILLEEIRHELLR